jgi:hypothetical protein
MQSGEHVTAVSGNLLHSSAWFSTQSQMMNNRALEATVVSVTRITNRNLVLVPLSP